MKDLIKENFRLMENRQLKKKFQRIAAEKERLEHEYREVVDLNILSLTEEKVWNCLRKAKGTENAVTSRQLSSWLGIDQRRVRATIHSLREKGLPIASSSNGIQGYFIPKNKEEADICRRHLLSRVSEIMKVVRALDHSFPGDGSQGVLF